MGRHLLTVDQVFTIEGLGTGVVGLTLDQYGSVHPGDRVELKRPDGLTVLAIVLNVVYPPSVIWADDRPPNPRYPVVIDVPRDEVLVGSEVWLPD